MALLAPPIAASPGATIASARHPSVTPRLDILPPQQRQLWPDLAQLPSHFVLYGGTAIALRLGGRQSLDFDFFTSEPISADDLTRRLAFLSGAELLQVEPNTATFALDRDGEVKVSFFGGLTIGRVGVPDRCDDNGVHIASPLDLAAQKMKVILVRAEPKDYLDIYALITSGVTLPHALGAAKALYSEFNPVLSLKALTYYGEPSLESLPVEVRQFLTDQAANTQSIQTVPGIATIIGTVNS
jgi:hypothetical protein